MGVRNDVDGLYRLLRVWTRRIAPVAQNMDVGLFVLHHTVSVVDLFGQANGVHLSADPRDFAGILPAIGVGIGEVDRRIARPLGVIRVLVGNPVVPVGAIAFDRAESEALGGVLIGVVRSLLEAKVGRRKIVPEAPRSFIAIVFRFHERSAIAAFGAVSAEH